MLFLVLMSQNIFWDNKIDSVLFYFILNMLNVSIVAVEDVTDPIIQSIIF